MWESVRGRIKKDENLENLVDVSIPSGWNLIELSTINGFNYGCYCTHSWIIKLWIHTALILSADYQSQNKTINDLMCLMGINTSILTILQSLRCHFCDIMSLIKLFFYHPCKLLLLSLNKRYSLTYEDESTSMSFCALFESLVRWLIRSGIYVALTW